MVVGHGQVHHVADRDHLAEVGVLDHHGPLHQRAGAEDGDLGLVDDRGVHQGAGRTVVGDREGAAGQLVRGHLVRSRTGGEVGDLLGQPGDVEVAGVLDHRNEEALRSVHRNADVLGIGVVHHLLVDGRVDLGVDLQRFDRGLGDEGEVGQARALAPLEVLLVAGPDPGDRGQVHLNCRRELGRDLQGLDHPAGDGLAQPRHLLARPAQRAVL